MPTDYPIAATRSRWHFPAWTALVLAATYLVFVGGTWPGIYASQFRVVTLVLTLGIFLAWAIAARKSSNWLPRSALLPAMAVSLASLAIATIFSRIPRVSAEYLGYAILLWGLYLLLVRLLADPFFRRRFAVLSTLMFVAISVAFVAAITVDWIEFWRVLGHLAIPPLRPNVESLSFGNPSAVLTIVALFAVPTVAHLGGSRTGRLATVVVVLGIAVVALLSGSRAGWVAIGLTILIAAGVALAVPTTRSTILEMVHAVASRPPALAGALLALVALGGVAAVFLPGVLSRFASGGEEVRAGYAAVAIRLFAQSPLVGVGPGIWAVEHVAQTAPDETLYYIPHAHNVELQTLAEQGLVGALAGVVAVIVVIGLVRDGIRDEDPARRRWAWLAGLGLVYFVLHQQLDFYLNFPGFLFAAAIPIAYLDATSSQRLRFSGSGRLSPRVSLAGLAAVALSSGLLLWQEVPAGKLGQATALANAGNWAAAAAPAAEAAAMDPDISPYVMTAALAAARTGDHQTAVLLFGRVARRDDLPEAWLDLASELQAAGRISESKAALQGALRVGQQDPTIAMAAGDLALDLGDRATAAAAFAAAIQVAPSLAGDPWARQAPDRAVAFDAAAQRVLETAAPALRMDLQLMLGDDAAASKTSAENGLGAEALISAWSGDPAAERTVLDQCERKPTDVAALSWCVRLETHLGKTAEAQRFRRLADVNAAVPTWMRVKTEATGPTIVGGAYQWGTYTYRRPTPVDLLLPSLIHLTLQ
ncbi:MAG: O-antigen ligase family protein [Chloroflexota bacterium]